MALSALSADPLAPSSPLSHRVTWQPIPDGLTYALMDFASRRNIGKAIAIGDVDYTLDYISQSTNAFWKSRGLSIYFRVGRSVIRISDHWSSSRGFPKSRQLNCGLIDKYLWDVKNRRGECLSLLRLGGSKYPYRVIAGRAGLVRLNDACPHWRR